MVDLDVVGVEANGAIVLRLSADGLSSDYRLTISQDLPGGYSHEYVAGPKVSFRKPQDEALPLADYLQKDPFIIRYADGTLPYNCYHIAANLAGRSLR